MAMLRPIVPRNARSKRALEARAPKEVEDERTAIFVRGSHTGQVLNGVMKDLNVIHPFEPEGMTSLEFWSAKNDATFFVVGTSTKKRPDNLTLVRTFDGKVLDMCELGVQRFVPMEEYKTKKSTPGYKPLMHFASPLFDTHPRLAQVRSLLLCLFNAEAIDTIALRGIEHVISVQLGPLPPSSTTTPLSGSIDDDPSLFPPILLRTYTIALKSSNTKIPYVDLVPMGPSLDLVLRRHMQPDPVLLAASLKRPKLAKRDVESGLGDKKKMRNKEVDEMGDLRGRIHIAKQDLSKLQTRKVKALKRGLENVQDDDSDVSMDSTPLLDQEDNQMDVDSPRKKRRKV
ncbi:SubName: Full=Related to protein RPF2 involved in ribosomal large subunit assembly and maintenance {ECO:0000313/EMBL:CCA70210.1} [Serendipita indica DSM 11827]|nr:SubName: Full=Related to protein RPF2 involved in ribosomal large subunit assembly and maintenance {ECO:0000313/EMBL:CCA70210.1} [Serendipita indica DSM 11827]